MWCVAGRWSFRASTVLPTTLSESAPHAGRALRSFDPADPCSYCDTPDAQIYRHFLETGRQFPSSVVEALARRLHDHAMTDCMDLLLAREARRVVAVMGGHGMKRDHHHYAAVARMSRSLAERGFFLVSGGGPGAMESTHVGAHFAHRSDGELVDALATLSIAPGFEDRQWLAAAFRTAPTIRSTRGPARAWASPRSSTATSHRTSSPPTWPSTSPTACGRTG